MKNKALFLDRDGVINVEKNYVHKIEDFEFIEGIFEILKFFQDQGFLLFIITNQAGIGRGYYTEHDFQILNNWMLDQFKNNGINITKVYYCPYHPEFGIGEYKRDSFCRKPNPGMIFKAKEEYDIDLSQSLLIGDKESDIEAGLNANVRTTILFQKSSEGRKSKASVCIKDLRELFDLK